MGDWVDQNGDRQGSVPFAGATIVDDDTEQVLTFDITTLATEWTNGSRPNNGVLLRHDRGGPFNFRSREYAVAADRPTLRLVANGVTHSLTAEADTILASSTFTSQGKAEFLRVRNDNNAPLIRFDLSAFMGQVISSAELKLTSYVQYGGGSATIQVFSVPANITEDQGPTLGLAAGFVQDAEVSTHPDVFMATSFDEGGTDDLTSWRDKWSIIDGNIGLVTETDPHKFSPLDGRALRMFFGTGEFYGMNIRYRFEDKHGAEPEDVYFRYYLRLGDNWDQTVQGGKLPGIAGTYGRAGWGGRRPSETDSSKFGWSARGLFNLTIPDGNNPLQQTTPIGSYVYHLDQSGSFGSSETWNQGPGAYLSRNRWYCVEHHVKMNTVGQADGVVRGWVDGRLTYERTNYRFRSVNDLKVQEIWMNFYHGGTIPSPYEQHAYVDNVVIAKSYIGPLASSRPRSFSEWLNSYDPTLTGDSASPLADPDADGLPNLLEYALDSHSPSTDPRSISPSGSVDSDCWATYNWRQNLRSQDLIYTVESSTDLSDWNPVNLDESTAVQLILDDNIDGDGSAQLNQTRVRMTAERPFFLRLRVDLN